MTQLKHLDTFSFESRKLEVDLFIFCLMNTLWHQDGFLFWVGLLLCVLFHVKEVNILYF